MDKIKDVKFIACENSLYLKPARMLYEQDGKKKSWDLMQIHDSVSIIIYNISRKVLVFVKQFRPAIYNSEIKEEDKNSEIDVKKYPANLGMTVELCAGIVDKDQSLVETARDEILEECGYSVPLSSIEKVTSFRDGVAISGCRQVLYYAEVTDAMKVSEGGGLDHEGECIEVIEMDLPKARLFIYDESVPRPTWLVLALLWFFTKKFPAES